MRDFQHSLPMALLKAREAAMSRFRPMLREHGLTEQQWRTVRTISADEGIDASELARRSFLLSPSLTRILQFLERKNIVRRSSDPNDQRRSVFVLTTKGRKLFSEIAFDSEILYREIEQDFGLDKLEQLYGLLAEFFKLARADE
ncbi:MAG: homoprotocatechuate degradation operon regulator HpaR [Gammaproteobacteria bacterium]|nr:homoprotocatechuate degradation operon regulator HpaR [Gammaproteobacteria bacterium]